MSEEKKVLAVPVSKYAKLCYMLILVSGAFGLLTSLLAIVGMYVGFGGLFGLLGLIGFALAVTAFLAFSENFGDLDLSHFKFLTIIFIIFFVFNMILFNAVVGFGVVGSIISFVIMAGEIAILYAGYLTWKSGQMATVDNIKSNLKDLKKLVISKVSDGTKE